jgi:hypothetical protein
VLTDFSGGVAMWGRLSTGASPQAAEAELTILTAELRQQHPKEIWENERLLSKPGGHPELTGVVEVFTLVGILVLLILAVACGNLGSLLLARGASREREMALRAPSARAQPADPPTLHGESCSGAHRVPRRSALGSLAQGHHRLDRRPGGSIPPRLAW